MATLVTLLALAGCGSGSDGGVDSAAGPEQGVAAEDAGSRAGAGERGGADAPAQQGGSGATDTRVEQRAIIYTGTMRVEVDDVEAAAREAISSATRAGGFVGGDQRRSTAADAVATLELRVPAAAFAPVVEEIAGLGRQQRREIGTQDVTEETIDLDARIASQRARVDSARRLLARASSISDLVSLENELARRESDLASLEAKKRRLADLTALSTITVTLVGPDATTSDEEDEAGFLVGLSAGWRVFLTSVTVLLTVLGAVLPWLLAFGVPLGLLWWVTRRRRQRLRADAAPAGRPTPGQQPTPPVEAAVSAPPPVPGARSAP
ncbi:protein of unknown function [Micromonospora nigra]|uniref:DUF4349 domain-containing protein n=1 Tax=Micromonospora nigra TaxID=145857 RepID=A0A1C6SDH2_9ACTN|nr:protein of unknown function [Micromonospora nigra]